MLDRRKLFGQFSPLKSPFSIDSFRFLLRLKGPSGLSVHLTAEFRPVSLPHHHHIQCYGVVRLPNHHHHHTTTPTTTTPATPQNHQTGFLDCKNRIFFSLIVKSNCACYFPPGVLLPGKLVSVVGLWVWWCGVGVPPHHYTVGVGVCSAGPPQCGHTTTLCGDVVWLVRAVVAGPARPQSSVQSRLIRILVESNK